MFQPKRQAPAGAAAPLSAFTARAASCPASAVAAQSASDGYAAGFNEASVSGGVQHGLILRSNRSRWSADTGPTAGTFSPLYGAATLPGVTNEWRAGISGTGQALILSHG